MKASLDPLERFWRIFEKLRGEEDMPFQIKNKIFFATENPNKILEAQQILSEYEIEVKRAHIKKVETQSERLEDIVSFALKQIRTGKKLMIVEDSGLFINRLNDFPGPYSSFVFKKIGCDGILKLMEGEQFREAKFVSVIGYKSNQKKALFRGETYGKISHDKVGKSGFGFDPIFIPEDRRQTFAEIEMLEKNRISHRGKAFRALGEWLQKTKYI